MNQRKFIMLGVIFVAIISLIIAAPGAMAQEIDDTTEEDEVDIGVGQSLNVVVDSVSNDIENDIEEAARNRKLGSASSESDRALILAEDLNRTEIRAQEIRESYNSLLESYENGNITKTEFIVETSKLNDKSKSITKNIENIRYASQFIPESELSAQNVTNQRLSDARSKTGIVGSDVAQEIRKSTVNRNANISVNASENALDATIKNNNGKLYKGQNKDRVNHSTFSITEEEALEIVELEFNINVSDYELDVDRDDDGYYEVELENEFEEYEIEIDGLDGSIISSKYESENETEFKVTEEEAIQIAESQFNINSSDYDVEIDKDDSTYEIEFENEFEEYEIEINGFSGTVMSIESDVDREDNKEFKITEEEAIQIAESQFNINSSDYDVEIDKDNSKYEIKLENEFDEYEIEINGFSGTIMSIESDVDREDNKEFKITEEEAIQIAESQFNINSSDYDVEIDKDNSKYEIKLENEFEEYEIEINGFSGMVMSVESDIDREEENKSEDERDNNVGSYNITEEEALSIVERELNINLSEYDIDIEKENGYYKIELENDSIEYEIEINGTDGTVENVEEDEEE